jgi:hypothetical protein
VSFVSILVFSLPLPPLSPHNRHHPHPAILLFSCSSFIRETFLGITQPVQRIISRTKELASLPAFVLLRLPSHTSFPARVRGPDRIVDDPPHQITTTMHADPVRFVPSLCLAFLCRSLLYIPLYYSRSGNRFEHLHPITTTCNSINPPSLGPSSTA